jgi:MSHA pilin protein MshA
MGNKGFTLMELIIVIVVLGILSALAIPKFANVNTDAKKAVVKDLAGSIRSSANIVRSKWLVLDDINITQVTLDGDNVTVDTTTGFPTADANGIAKAVNYDTNKFTFDASSGCFKYNNLDTCKACYTLDTTNKKITVTTTLTDCH